jgi:uncharacterized cupredoxin-like copper-binding protein
MIQDCAWLMRRTGWVLVAALAFILPSDLAAQEGNTVEVEIRNSTYHVNSSILVPDQPAVIRLRNRDTIRHGFISPRLGQQLIEVESSVVEVIGGSIQKIHIAPGHEVMIRFIPTGPGRFEFQCDLHPEMKGEFLALEIGVS